MPPVPGAGAGAQVRAIGRGLSALSRKIRRDRGAGGMHPRVREDVTTTATPGAVLPGLGKNAIPSPGNASQATDPGRVETIRT